jgi:hypothetical protein
MVLVPRTAILGATPTPFAAVATAGGGAAVSTLDGGCDATAASRLNAGD